MLQVPLVDEPNPQKNEEKKISSSTKRLRDLGTLLRPVNLNSNIPTKPYIIGLTGTIDLSVIYLKKQVCLVSNIFFAANQYFFYQNSPWLYVETHSYLNLHSIFL